MNTVRYWQNMHSQASITFLNQKFFNKYPFALLVLQHNGEKKLSSRSLFFASWGFAAVSLSNLTVSPHPVWFLAGVLAGSAGRAFSGAFFFFYPLLQLQCVVSSLRASKAHGCRPSGKEGQRKREAEGGGKNEKEGREREMKTALGEKKRPKDGGREEKKTEMTTLRDICAQSTQARESEGLHSSFQVVLTSSLHPSLLEPRT